MPQTVVASLLAAGLLLAMLIRLGLWIVARPAKGSARYTLIQSTLLGIAALFVMRRISDELPEALGERFQTTFGVFLITFGLAADLLLLWYARNIKG